MNRFASTDLSILVIERDGETYTFIYDDAHRGELLRKLGEFAGNPELNFSWMDAAICSQKIRHANSNTF